MEHSTALKSTKKVKSSGTIAQGNFLVRSYLTFGAIEAKIFTLLLAGIDKEDKNLKRIEFPMSLITNYKGGSAYEAIHEACMQLMAKKINAHPEDSKRKKGFHYYQVVIDCGLDLGKGIISGQFHPDVEKYLIDLKKNYTISEIEELLKLKSGYSHRLFWYLKSYENIKSKYRREPFEEFKNIMLGETPETSYQNSDFRRFVLEPSFKEVVRSNAFKDFNGEPTVRYTLERKGRIVTHIRFDFSKQAQLSLFDKLEHGSTTTNTLLRSEPEISILLPDKLRRPFERLVEYGLTEQQAKVVIEKVPIVELNKVLYKLNNDIIVDKMHLKLNRTAGIHSVMVLKEKFSVKYKLWLSQ
ncbi:hypothetical protein AHMF7616_05254 [Adhaeribacter pallidiroseus]|uniref:Initiator Rep protein WH1 domain-containing protein n=2 Tax=Adhaeribacter pallidiroseus TaxID=2072847 RepID=A0A369Q2Y4_9BACT|nr:hypothetical protein AHMF7616_05254 [Adhaeribacter pallidiroseus]